MIKKLLPLSVLLVSLGAAAQGDYSNGVFIVNEDWYGHQNSTVNYFDHSAADGEMWQYRVIQTVNPGVELGCTNQYGQIYGDRFYLIAKQEKDPGASIVGGRITVADAKTMQVLFQSTIIDPAGGSCDGRGYLGVDEHKGYISTSNGVWVFDTDAYVVTGRIAGSENPNTDSYGSLYFGQCGSMVRVNERVFVANQSQGLLVIDPEIDEVTDIITMEPINEREAELGNSTSAGIGSVVLACDGNLYLSIAKDVTGSGAALPYLMKVNPATLEVEVIDIPDGIYPPGNSWYAWTPDGFCASTVNNTLFWNGGENSWFTGTRIFRYDIDTNEFTKIIDLNNEPDNWQLYGCSMRPHPVTDELYLSLYHSFGDPTYCLRRSDANGNTLGQYDMITNYWFPSLPVFPDNEYPEFRQLATQEISQVEPTLISLSGLATDADNLDAAIVKSVKNVSSSAFTAQIVNGDLVVTPIGEPEEEDGSVELSINSNGHVITATIPLHFSGAGVDRIENPQIAAISVSGNKIMFAGCNGKTARIYTVDGRLVDTIIVMDDDYTYVASLPVGVYVVTAGANRALLRL